MGMLIAAVIIAAAGLLIGVLGGISAGQSQQVVMAAIRTVGAYYVLVGIPSAWLLMTDDGRWLDSFVEAYIAIARSLMLLGLVPLLVTFAISWLVAR